MPHSLTVMPLPRGLRSTADHDPRSGPQHISKTQLLPFGRGSLVAALRDRTLLTYDLHTAAVQQQLLGHLFRITDIAASPAAWHAPYLFASCSVGGDVKIWDLRAGGR